MGIYITRKRYRQKTHTDRGIPIETEEVERDEAVETERHRETLRQASRHKCRRIDRQKDKHFSDG